VFKVTVVEVHQFRSRRRIMSSRRRQKPLFKFVKLNPVSQIPVSNQFHEVGATADVDGLASDFAAHTQLVLYGNSAVFRLAKHRVRSTEGSNHRRTFRSIICNRRGQAEPTTFFRQLFAILLASSMIFFHVRFFLPEK
jgi:hypothetical protein